MKKAQKRVINWNKHYAKIARLETLFILQWAQKNEVLDQCYVILNLLCSTGVCVFCTYRSKELVPPSPKRYSKRINSKFEFQQKLIQFNIWFNNGWPKFNSNNYSIKKIAGNSIQSMIQFKCQGIINTGQINKINRQKRGGLIKYWKYLFNIWLYMIHINHFCLDSIQHIM